MPELEAQVVRLEAKLLTLAHQIEKIDTRLSTRPDEGRVLFLIGMVFLVAIASVGLAAGFVAASH